ncbi:hypothetical protein KM043_018232 [Ampulex compressa]|nr:hypothetical protein KM043_018232 [Ampulex compressa]
MCIGNIKSICMDEVPYEPVGKPHSEEYLEPRDLLGVMRCVFLRRGHALYQVEAGAIICQGYYLQRPNTVREYAAEGYHAMIHRNSPTRIRRACNQCNKILLMNRSAASCVECTDTLLYTSVNAILSAMDITSLSKGIHKIEGQGEQTPKDPLDALYSLKEIYCLTPWKGIIIYQRRNDDRICQKSCIRWFHFFVNFKSVDFHSMIHNESWDKEDERCGNCQRKIVDTRPAQKCPDCCMQVTRTLKSKMLLGEEIVIGPH